jgi:hypothetical protein
MTESRTRQIVIGFIALVVLVVAIALAVGGGGSSNESGGSAGSSGATSTGSKTVEHGAVAARPGLPIRAPAPSFGSAASAGPTEDTAKGSGVAQSAVAQDAGNDLTATRVVKTGSMSLTVKRGEVGATVSKLISLATQLGGYVSSSRTDSTDGAPSGNVTLRVPVDSFNNAVTAAALLGHQTSLTTSAHDVTGHYVDLTARKAALIRTRSTYLTILSQAKSIGSTLAVQQRLDDVQQQIEELQGQLKVLSNQTAYSTLAVEVSQVGAVTTVPVQAATGIGAAWHRSVHRFTRGIDGIVGILGPLLLALLILGALAVLAFLGYRIVRRYTVPASSGSES